MPMAGRPPKPLEEHKRTGTYNAAKHGAKSALAVAIAPLERLPHELTPAEAFTQVMEDGIVWLGRTDAPSVALLGSLLDERGALREAALAGSTEARKHLRDLDRQVIGLLSDLGFTPAGRSRLGLAEVKTQSKLADLQAKQVRR